MSYFLKGPTKTLLRIVFAGSIVLLASCGNLTSNKKGVTSKGTAKPATNLDVLNSDSGHTIRMSWEVAIEQTKTLTGYSVEPDKRGDLGVYCFANETSCRKAASEIRNTVIGGVAYRDNPVAIQALELQFKVPINSLEVSLVMATPVMRGNAAKIEDATRAELWFKDLHVLKYEYLNGTKKMSAVLGSSMGCDFRTDSAFGFAPEFTDEVTKLAPAVGDKLAYDYVIYRGPRLLTGLGMTDHGVRQAGTPSNIYSHARFGWAQIHHLGLAPSTVGGKFKPTFIPNAISAGTSATAPVSFIGEVTTADIHKIGWNAFTGERPELYHQQLIVGMCIKGSATEGSLPARHPLLGAFFRTNLFMLKDCDMESCK